MSINPEQLEGLLFQYFTETRPCAGLRWMEHMNEFRRDIEAIKGYHAEHAGERDFEADIIRAAAMSRVRYDKAIEEKKYVR